MGIRARLTLCFAVTFGVFVVALAVLFYVIDGKLAYSRLDTELQTATDATALSAQHEMSEHNEKAEGETDLQVVLSEVPGPDYRDTQIVVRDGDRVVAIKRGSGPELRSLPLAKIKKAGTFRGLRVADRQLSLPQFGTILTIYAAKPVALTADHVATTRDFLLFVVPLGLLLACSVSYMLAGRVLRPLREFADVVEATNSSDLTARVPLHNSRIKPAKSSWGVFLKGEDEIDRLAVRFNALLDRLEVAFKRQRTFMADASHQIRTPVTIALAAAQVMGSDESITVVECRETLETIERQMLLLRKIVEDMFFLSQSDIAPMKLVLKETYLDDAVVDATRAAAPLARNKGIELVRPELPEAKCLGDANLLTQAIMILLDNAIKFTPAGGTVSIDLIKRGADWVCSVTDTGIGIPTGDQGRIFERFFQVNRPESDTVKGAGLGLAIARSIIDSHGGKLALVESHPGRTVFEIALPISEDTASTAFTQAKCSAVRI